jgi:hypothetical protein
MKTTHRMLLAVAVIGVLAVAQPASAHQSAAPSRHVRSPSVVRMTFQGRPIDLSKGWGKAHSCVVWRAAHLTKCFRSDRQMRVAVAAAITLIADDTDVAASSCSSPLDLWQDEGYSNRHLQFWDRGFWQNLSNWSFNNQLSSFIVGACGVHLAENGNGGGLWYPCNTSAGAQHREMDLDDNNGGPPCGAQSTNWNDRVSSIFIT